MRNAAFVVVAAAFALTGCASGAGTSLYSEQEVCGPRIVWLDNNPQSRPLPQSGHSATVGSENPLMSKANCDSNRAEARQRAVRMEQRQNQAVSFPAESPPPG